MTKKRTLKTFAAGLTALALTLPMVPARAAATTYWDVSGHAWYSGAVAFCQRYSLMDGLSDGSFAPDGQMTRAALAEALYRLAGSPTQEGEDLPFTDVGPDHPNLAAIRWAKASGVVSGYEDGAFGPEDPITREQIAALLWNQQGGPQADGAAPFGDRDSISGWAQAAADWAYGAKMMQGSDTGDFLPRDNTTRAQGAAVVMNYAQAFYGLRQGYDLPAPQPMSPNRYLDAAFRLDERGYLSYAGGERCTRGLDVSSHQKEVDWAKVAAAGMDFAMIRVGYRGYGSGLIVKDDYFDANMRGALANGLEVGVYFYSQAINPREAEEEARQVLEWIKDYRITYPVVFDWEEQDLEGARSQGADGNTVTACALAFCKLISDAGYLPMLYGSPKKVYSGGIQLEYLQDYPFWLAHYTKDTAPTSFQYNYHMWQYTSSGQVDGIEGRVDLNLCMADWSSWSGGRQWWIGPV